MYYYQPLAAEISATDSAAVASTIGDARLIRTINTSTTASHLVTLQTSDATLIGNMSVGANESVIINKKSTDELFGSDAALKFTPITIPKG